MTSVKSEEEMHKGQAYHQMIGFQCTLESHHRVYSAEQTDIDFLIFKGFGLPAGQVIGRISTKS